MSLDFDGALGPLVDLFEPLSAGQALGVPADLAGPGRERRLMLALVDRCLREAVPLSHVMAPPRAIWPRPLDSNSDLYRGVQLIQDPYHRGQIVLIRG